MKIRRINLVALLVSVSAWVAVPAPAATSKTFVVTSASAGGPSVPGTLTWAVYQANYSGGDINYINFNIPGLSSETTMTLTEALFLARPTIINATTQPGYSGRPLIHIDCNRFSSGFVIVGAVAGIPPMSDGSPATGTGSSIQGFRITHYINNAITILLGANSTLITKNEIGFIPPSGSSGYFRNVSVSQLCGGIGIQSSFNVIRSNTISGAYNAITVGEDISNQSGITGSVFKNNTFAQNFIGTDPTGTTKIGNDSDGIFFGAGCKQNFIGPGNVLSGMGSAGVEFLHPSVTDNIIFGNIIGLNAAGTSVIPNGELGVLIANGAANNSVGGPYGGSYAGNVISANAFGGVAIGTAEFPGPDGSNNNRVEGNLIGTDGSGTTALGTQNNGVTIQSKSKGNVVRRNVILGQMNNGVVLSDANSNALYGNWIGMTRNGALIANGDYGVYLANSSSNTIQLPAANAGIGTEQNYFGANTRGRTAVSGSSIANIIDASSPPPPAATPTPTPASGPPRLVNISTRVRVETGDNVTIAGFIIPGNSAKRLIIRATGPSLGIQGGLSDPTLQLVTSAGSVSNDDWRLTQEQEIIASTLAPSNNQESAIIATLNPGAYTAIVRGKGDSTGIGLVEVYDLDSSAPALLANISTRGVIRTGDSIMIAGFILGAGNTQSRIVIRALGPSLSAVGVSSPLNDPTLKLVDSNGTTIRQCDNWQDDASQAEQISALNLAPKNSVESAVVATLPAGAYTALVSDKNGNAGTGLVEVYHAP